MMEAPRESDTEGPAWAYARIAASMALGSAYSTFGEPDPIPWWRPIPPSFEEQVALAKLRLLEQAGTLDRKDST